MNPVPLAELPTAELIERAHQAAPLYGNDWGALLTAMADRLEQVESATIKWCAEFADRIDTVNGIGDRIRLGRFKADSEEVK